MTLEACSHPRWRYVIGAEAREAGYVQGPAGESPQGWVCGECGGAVGGRPTVMIRTTLDVERLAEALHKLPHHYRGGADDDLARIACTQMGRPTRCDRQAASIAREYAALAPAPDLPRTDDRYTDAIREAAASTQPEVLLAVKHRLYITTGDHLAHLELTFMPRLAEWRAKEREAYRQELLAAVEGLAHSGTVWTGGRVLLHRADVLALLEAPSAGSQPA